MAVPLLKELGIALFGVFIAILFAGAILFFVKASKNKDMKNHRVYNTSMALFVLFIAISYIIRVYFMFFIARTDQEFIDQMTATERSVEALPLYNDGRIELLQVLWQWHMAFIFIGIGFLTFGTEYLMYRKTKFLLTILAFATMPLILIFPYDIAHKIYFIMYLSPVLWLFVYITIAKNSTGSLRRNAVAVIGGVVLFIVGVFMNSDTVREWMFGSSGSYHVTELGAIFSAWFSPVLLIVGLLIAIMALNNKF